MKTTFALLLMTDGRPVMRLKELCELFGITERTAENQIYQQVFPVPAFKAGAKWVAHVQDVAAYIDSQRAAAIEQQQRERG